MGSRPFYDLSDKLITSRPLFIFHAIDLPLQRPSHHNVEVDETHHITMAHMDRRHRVWIFPINTTKRYKISRGVDKEMLFGNVCTSARG